MLRPKHPAGCCRPTTVAVYRDSDLVDIQIHHHCGRTREHIQPRNWRAAQ